MINSLKAPLLGEPGETKLGHTKDFTLWIAYYKGNSGLILVNRGERASIYNFYYSKLYSNFVTAPIYKEARWDLKFNDLELLEVLRSFSKTKSDMLFTPEFRYILYGLEAEYGQ